MRRPRPTLRGRVRGVARALVLGGAFAAGVAAAAGAAPAPAPATREHVVHARPAPASAAAAKPAAKAAPARKPLTLAAQNIQGRAEGARVLFVHTGPKIALEDAPKHPSYLRDDFTAALSSPVTVHVRNIEPLRAPTTPGGSR